MKNEKEKQKRKRVQVLDRNVTHCTTYICFHQYSIYTLFENAESIDRFYNYFTVHCD